MTASPSAIAALVPAADEDAGRVVQAFVGELQAAGRRVRGLLQESSAAGIVLVDVENGRRYGISQKLGRLSASCSLDLHGLTAASEVLRRIAKDGADLVVFNRFSGLEAQGRGFAGEMLDIMSRGMPTLVIVRLPWLPAWRTFTGGLACELRPDAAALAAWFAAAGRRG